MNQMNEVSGPVDVLAVIESHRDRYGDLDKDGWALEQSRQFALRNHGFDDAVLWQALKLKARDDSLRSAGRVPVVTRWRRARAGSAS